jgi:hypothetical protein
MPSVTMLGSHKVNGVLSWKCDFWFLNVLLLQDKWMINIDTRGRVLEGVVVLSRVFEDVLT